MDSNEQCNVVRRNQNEIDQKQHAEHLPKKQNSKKRRKIGFTDALNNNFAIYIKEFEEFY